VLLTDVVMPGMNGAELARLAPGVRSQLTILFMSGYTDPEEITGALRRYLHLWTAALRADAVFRRARSAAPRWHRPGLVRRAAPGVPALAILLAALVNHPRGRRTLVIIWRGSCNDGAP
jgi:CheY-like chemotaxis protein